MSKMSNRDKDAIVLLEMVKEFAKAYANGDYLSISYVDGHAWLSDDSDLPNHFDINSFKDGTVNGLEDNNA